MTFWLLYIIIDGQLTQDYPFHFAYKETCDKIGRQIVKDYKYEGWKCVQEKRE